MGSPGRCFALAGKDVPPKDVAMPSGPFTLIHEDVTADCASPQSGERGTRDELDLETVRGCLEAFAAIPAVDLVDLSPKIRLRLQSRQVAVGRSGSSLYFSPIPATSHTAEHSTPEGILAYLTEVPLTAETPDETDSGTGKRTKKFSLGLSLGAQIGVLAVLLSVIAGLFVHETTRAPSRPGYVLITDPTRIAELQRLHDGRYGDSRSPNTLSFELSNGQISYFISEKPDAPLQTADVEKIEYALKEGALVLLGSHGNVLSFNAAGQLVYGSLSYPRTGK